MTKSLRVGLLHLAPALGAVGANGALIDSGTRVAARFGAHWVVSWELVVCGYRFATLLGTEWIGGQPDAWMRRLAELRPLGRHRKLRPTLVSEGWASGGKLGPPVPVDGLRVELLVRADANAAQLLVSSAASWPGEWGPSGAWGRDGESDIIDAESVIVARGLKLLTLRAADSTVFVVEGLIDSARAASGELAAKAPVSVG